MKIAIATNNPNKLREIRAILGGFFDEALSLADLGIDIDIEETGTTLTENALIKARTIRDLTGLPARRRQRADGGRARRRAGGVFGALRG